MTARNHASNPASSASLFVALVLAILCTPARGEWVRTYPFTGVVVWTTGVVSAPSDPDRVYAFISAYNTPWVLISDDGGLTWTKSAPYAGTHGPQFIAVDPLHRDTIYVASAEDGLYKSSDGGAHFDRLGPFSRPAIDPSDSRIVYATRVLPESGIVKSVDGGVTWADTGRHDDTYRIAIDPNDSRIVYATGDDVVFENGLPRFDGAVYRSLDGGATWTMVFKAPSLYVGWVAVDARSRVYAKTQALEGDLLSQSTNFGDLWSRLPVGIPTLDSRYPNPNLESMSPDPRSGDTLYLATGQHGAVASWDGGTTWQILGGLPNQALYTWAIAVIRNGVIVEATEDGLYRWTPPGPRRRAARTTH